MSKLKKLKLNKTVVAKLQDSEMKKMQGGAFDSRVCGTYWKTGACYGAGHTTAGLPLCW